eukprot:Nitzschia sp. Nitz4//scaffold335_size18684//3509//4522//NITZ4_008768-RA/size18684-processed-gene-0.3-mRNA-1//-1//CDS//3329548270//4368//frame0
MRFSIAAAILAQALPVLAFNSNDHRHLLDATDVENVNMPNHHPLRRGNHPLLGEEEEHEDGASPPQPAASMHKFGGGRGGGSGPLVNRTRASNQEELEQNLKARFDTQFRGMPVGAECDPDVGILTCGMGKVCKKDESSDLGGVCAPRPMGTRKLEDELSQSSYYSDSGMGYYYCVRYADYFDCDCSGWDSWSGTGSLTCTERGNCPSGCNDLCYDFTISYSMGWYSFTLGFCYQSTSPYRQKLCVSYTYGTGCYVKLNNKKCSSCDMMSSYCGSWDCRNNNMGTGDFCYDIPLAPIVMSECYGVNVNSGETDPALLSLSTACSLGVSAAMVAAYGL